MVTFCGDWLQDAFEGSWPLGTSNGCPEISRKNEKAIELLRNIKRIARVKFEEGVSKTSCKSLLLRCWVFTEETRTGRSYTKPDKLATTVGTA